MQAFLLFQLYGPLQAWGEIAVGEVRDTRGVPTRSGILGLLAAALGIRRHEEERLQELENSYGLALRIDASGALLRDYHSIQTPKPPKKRQLFTRAEELQAERFGGSLSTILSRRDYLTDARFVACIWQRTDNAPHSMEELAAALKHPCFTLCLGRKSCPPALPLAPRVEEHAGLAAALKSWMPTDPERGLLRGNRYAGPELAPAPGACCSILWEGEWEDLVAVNRHTRWDRCRSAARRQFGPREECHGRLTL